MRLMIAAALFGVAYVLIAMRLVDLMVLEAGVDAPATRAANATVSTKRAAIVDRSGVLIATNLPTVDLIADSQKVLDAATTAARLIEALPDLRYDETLRKLTSGQKFIYLRRHLAPIEQTEVNALGLPGIDFAKSERRVYPQGALFAHVVGATDPDNHGNAGVERSLDETLRRSDAPAALALDARVQHAVRDLLATGISRFNAVAGSAVVMDVATAEVIAMVSLPDFDPKSLGSAPADARFNRASLGLYEMGSTFKLFTAAMALEAGSATLTSTYDATVPIKIGRFTIGDFHAQNRWMSVPDILIHSSNIGAAKMALDAGTEAQKTFLRQLGLLAPLGLELPEVGSPQFPATWRDINTITISYGHGISVTPTHVAAAVSALVNGGTYVPPTVVRRVAGGKPAGRRVISAQTSAALRALMRLVVLEGSGEQAEVAGYRVGGKTGSAEKVTAGGGYSERSLRTSFVGVFPIDAPRYVVLVVLDEPRATTETYGFATAGWNAAPTTGAIIAKIAPILGVFPTAPGETFEPLASLIAAREQAVRRQREFAAARLAAATEIETPGAEGASPYLPPTETTADEISALADVAGGTGEIE
jgi:cell division protein FtsI (penicillin-binding protein 3)